MADFPSVPFTEAIDALKRRGLNLFPSDHWAGVWQEQHHTGFTVARSAGFDVLKDIHGELAKAMEQGRTFREFSRDLIPILQKKGWWGKQETVDPVTGEIRTVQLGSLRRLETIFDVNLRVSAAQGRWEQILATAESHPYLVYDCVLDDRTRPQHRRWYRIVLPISHPFWKTHFPPNGWFCRCDVFAVSEADLARMGLTVSQPPSETVMAWTNPVTGEILLVPEGIDPGWAYNPGNTDQAARAARLAMDKLITLPPSLGAEAVTTMAFAFPQVERELAEWLGSLAVEAITSDRFMPQGVRRVLGCIDTEILAWLEARGIPLPQTAAITIADRDIRHILRTSKRERGNTLDVEDVRRLPTLLRRPDAVYWDNGGPDAQKRDEGLIYVWRADDRGLGKLFVRVDYATKPAKADREKGDKRIVTNSIRTGRMGTGERNFSETAGFVKIKGNL